MTVPQYRLAWVMVVAVALVSLALAGGAAAATIGSLTPSQAKAGDDAFVLVVDGEGFLDGASGSRVTWNGSLRPTTWVSANRLTAAISAADVDEALTSTVQVTTPGQAPSNARAFSVVNPKPSICDFDPPTRVRGSGSFVLTVKGAGFVRGSKVLWRGEERPTTYVDHGTLETTIGSADVAVVGSTPLQVVSPPPTPFGGLSYEWSYYVTNPIPVIASLSPAQGTLGAGDTTITITGSNFSPASRVTWELCANGYCNYRNNLGQYVSPTQMRVTVPASDLTSLGRGYIQVENPGAPYEYSDYVPWTIGVAPNTPPADAANVQLLGRDAATGALRAFTTAPYVWPGTAMYGRARFDDAEGGPLTIEVNWRYNNGSYLDNRFLSTRVSGPGVHDFPLPNLEASLAGAFVARVRARDADGAVGAWHYILPTDPDWTVVSDQPPVVTGVSPRTAPAGGASRTLTVDGSGFTRGAVVQWNGEARPTTFVSGSRLTATIPASDLAVAGGASVRVLNATFNAPATGQVSNATAFEVQGAGGTGALPVSIAAPTVSGTPRVGELLACSVGAWANAPSAFGITWLRDGQTIPGASGGTLLATAADAGHLLSCRVTAANAWGQAVAVSDVAVIGAGTGPAPVVVAPVIAPPAAGSGGATPAVPRTAVVAPRRLAIVTPLSVRAGKRFAVALRFDRRATRQLVNVQVRSGRRWVTVSRARVSGIAPLVRASLSAPGRRVLRVTWTAGGTTRASAPVVVLVTRRAR